VGLGVVAEIGGHEQIAEVQFQGSGQEPHLSLTTL